jgi:hypothetical protein
LIPKYKNIAVGALAVVVTGLGAAVVLGQGSTTGNVYGPGGAPTALPPIIGFALLVMFWAFAKAKGRSGWLGILLPFLSIVGLIILVLLKDKSLEYPADKSS